MEDMLCGLECRKLRYIACAMVLRFITWKVRPITKEGQYDVFSSLDKKRVKYLFSPCVFDLANLVHVVIC